MEWVARIMAVSLIMFVPGLCGQWLDRRFGTGFLTLIGFALGMTVGFYTLLVFTGATKKRQERQTGTDDR